MDAPHNPGLPNKLQRELIRQAPRKGRLAHLAAVTRHACQRGTRLGQGVEPDAFRKAEILHVSAELAEDALAVTGVGLASVASHASRQVGEEAGTTISSDVLHERQKSSIEQRLAIGKRSDGCFAF